MTCDNKTSYWCVINLFFELCFTKGALMAYLMILLAVALVIGPVLWMKPSRGQARQARIRLKARELGLDVRLTELPQTHRAAVRREDVRQGVVYRSMVYDPRKVLALSHRLIRDADKWEAEGDALPASLQRVLDQAREQLPASVVAIELGPQGPGVYWREVGDEGEVEQIAVQLQALLGAMRV